MAFKTAEEALADDRRVLGHKYGSAYYHCRQELWRVSSNWDRYETLFGSKERVEILNSSSGSFWHSIQNMLFEHVLLGICRLTDPSSLGSRANLSIETLWTLDPTKQKKALLDRIKRAQSFSTFARSWRNKRISHNDFEQMIGAADQLAPATRIKVSKAIVAVHDVLRWVQGRYFDGDLTLIELGDDDANQLLIALASGRELRNLEIRQMSEGNHKAIVQRRERYPNSDYGRKLRYARGPQLRQPSRYRGILPLNT